MQIDDTRIAGVAHTIDAMPPLLEFAALPLDRPMLARIAALLITYRNTPNVAQAKADARELARWIERGDADAND